MESNPVVDQMGRRLRLAVIGGGPGSFIGSTHRKAATMDGRLEIVAGVVSSNPARAIASAGELGIPRPYSSVDEMLGAESDRSDGAEVVAIMTPNDSHHEYSMAALRHELDVICDKPMTNTLEEALDIVGLVEESGLVFCLTHNYTGYPMVRQARAMVAEGELGEIRLVQVEYVQGGKADERDPDPTGDVPWRFDPAKGGPSLVMGDIGSHAHNLIRFITGLEVAEISAEIGHVVPGRRVDDFGAAMLRMQNGARGTFWVTQAAAGVENCLRIRVSGTKGSIEWWQENPTRLGFTPLDQPARTYTPRGPGLQPAAMRASRIVSGHPEGFQEAFANIYSDAAEAIAARRSGQEVDPLAMTFPNHLDGAIGVRFTEAALESSRSGAAWTDARLNL